MPDLSTHRSPELARQLGELVTLLRTSTDTALSPARVTPFLKRVVPHADHCGLTLLRRGASPATLSATSDVPGWVDQLQRQASEGPCLSAAQDRRLVLADDLARDPRWPVFGPRCVMEVGVCSMLAVHLPLPGDDLAAVNLYAHRANAFDEEDVATVAVFAPIVALTLQSELSLQKSENLEAALTSSRQIGIAIGILMVSGLVTEEEAFAELRATSQHLNRKLRDVAATVALTGQLPPVR